MTQEQCRNHPSFTAQNTENDYDNSATLSIKEKKSNALNENDEFTAMIRSLSLFETESRGKKNENDRGGGVPETTVHVVGSPDRQERVVELSDLYPKERMAHDVNNESSNRRSGNDDRASSTYVSLSDRNKQETNQKDLIQSFVIRENKTDSVDEQEWLLDSDSINKNETSALWSALSSSLHRILAWPFCRLTFDLFSLHESISTLFWYINHVVHCLLNRISAIVSIQRLSRNRMEAVAQRPHRLTFSVLAVALLIDERTDNDNEG